jgi:transposase
MMTVNTSEATASPSCLLLAIELGQRAWKLGFTLGPGQRPRLRQVAAGAVDALAHEVARAKLRLKLPADAAVVSCFEAGRDGFWLHRWLVAHGVRNHVVDSASIEVNRRARRAKTDRLDLKGLLSLLARFTQGDHRVWRVVRVPAPGEEDDRHLQRALETIQQDRTRLTNRVKGLSATQGVQIHLDTTFLSRVDTARLWDGAPLPDGIKRRLKSGEMSHDQGISRAGDRHLRRMMVQLAMTVWCGGESGSCLNGMLTGA